MNKKKLLLMLALVAVVLYFAYRNQSQGEEAQGETPQSATPVAKGDAEVVILSVNDIHSAVDQFPKFAAMVDSLRAVYPNLLLFSAGDNRTGNPVNDQYNPVNYPIIELMNRTGFDLSAVGNHEWDGGVANLQADIERADFPFLCANVVIPEKVELDIEPFTTLERNDLKISVVGVVELRADGYPGAHPNNFKELRFKYANEVLQKFQYLENQSDVVVLLSHCGFEEDLELAEANPWLDAIIGGHSHTLVEHPKETNGVLVTQSGSHLKNATLVKLHVKNGKVVGKDAIVLNVNNVRKEKAEIRKLVDGFNDAPSLNEAIATARTKFETPEEIGCMMTDAIREISGADFAFQNTGGVRVNHLKKGPITVKDVYTIDPFGNEIVMYQMTGEQVKEFIINSFRKNGGHPSYVSGMTYAVGDDGKSVRIEADGFSTHNIYKVAFNSYMASTVRIESIDDGQSLFKTSEEMIIEFLKKHKTVDYQGVVRTK